MTATVSEAPEAPEEIEDPREVLSDLRRARRRQRTRDFDVFEALYRAYITVILAGIAVWLLSGVTGDTRVSAATAAHVANHDAPVVGLVVAACWAAGLRSGGRGGPLVIEAADVRHVLLSPVDRVVSIRPVAFRQLRFGAFVGTVVGAIAGLLAFRRLPGGFPAWVVVGAVTGILLATSSLGLAMLVAGRRLGRYAGSGLAALVLAWSVVDLVTGVTTSPATFFGQLALWPLRFRPAGLIGPVVAVAALVAGWETVAGSSLEAAERRATLVGQIQFAATMRDLRTVVVLRRQLAQEVPRQRPWLRLPRSVPPTWLAGAGAGVGSAAGAASGGAAAGPATDGAGRRPVSHPARLPCWRRGWHGILRFPAFRLLRLAALGAAAGAAAVGMWRGTTPLLIVAGLCMYAAGLDAIEPLAQEIDHPDRRDGYDIKNGELQVRLLAPSVVVMLVVGAFGVLAAYLVSGLSPLGAQLGAVSLIPCALGGVAGASISTIQGAPPTVSSTAPFMPPEAAGIRTVYRALWPPVVATVGFLPLLAGRHAHVESPLRTVLSAEPLVLILMILIGIWVRYRDDIHYQIRTAMAEAKRTQAGRARPQR